MSEQKTRIVRVTEERAEVVEVHYDVALPLDVDLDEVEGYLDRANDEVDRILLSANYEITDAEEVN